MSPLLTEVQAMHNPALGAALVWRFACGYIPERTAGDGVPLALAFIVLPIVLHTRTREGVEVTRLASSMHKFEEKFDDQGDVLLAIHQRTIAMRPLSLESVRLALASGLVTLLPQDGTLWPRTYAAPRGAAKTIGSLMKSAEKLGTWCAPFSLFELSGMLRLEF